MQEDVLISVDVGEFVINFRFSSGGVISAHSKIVMSAGAETESFEIVAGEGSVIKIPRAILGKRVMSSFIGDGSLEVVLEESCSIQVSRTGSEPEVAFLSFPGWSDIVV